MTRKNQVELVTASFNNQEEPVWASYSQFQCQWKTSLSWSQPVSMTRKNQFEEVTVSINDKDKPVWASFNKQKEPVLS